MLTTPILLRKAGLLILLALMTSSAKSLFLLSEMSCFFGFLSAILFCLQLGKTWYLQVKQPSFFVQGASDSVAPVAEKPAE